MKETMMNEKILKQMVEVIHHAGALSSYEEIVLSLQLLAWAKLSKPKELQDALQKRSYVDADWLWKEWRSFEDRQDNVGLAFSFLNTPKVPAAVVGTAVDLCVRLAETGILEKFDPTDCLSPLLGKDAGEYTLPAELADVMVGLARLSKGMTVYTPWNNSNQLAVRATRLGATAYVETIREPQFAALMASFTEGSIKILKGDPIREPSAIEGGKLRQFDASIAFPPIGLRYPPAVSDQDWYGRFPEKTNSGTLLAVWHLLAQTKGRAVIAVPNSFLFSPGLEKRLREDLVVKGLLESVIAMPPGLLFNTNIPFALIVLNKDGLSRATRFLNADAANFRHPISKARAKLADIDGIIARALGTVRDEHVRDVSAEEIKANDFMLQMSRYVQLTSVPKAEALLASSPVKQLGELVSILRPLPTTAKDDALKAFEVGAADLPDFAFVAQPPKTVGIDASTAQKAKEQFLQPLDIILTIKGSIGKVGIVPEHVPSAGEGGWVVGQSAVILRVTDKSAIDPKTLALYLRSSLGDMLLKKIGVQGTIPIIQVRSLQSLPVITPTKSEAAKIAAILDGEAKIQMQIQELRNQQAELSKQLWTIE